MLNYTLAYSDYYKSGVATLKRKIYISIGKIAIAATSVAYVTTTIAILSSSQSPFDLLLSEKIAIFSSFALPIVISIPIAHYILSQNLKLEVLTDSLKSLQRTDSLTGLLTRSAFFHDVEALKTAEESQNQEHALFFIDLDNFKNINDVYGHQTGDKTLKVFGEVMADTIGENGVAGRIGGEEFCLFLPNCTSELAAKMAKKLLNRFQQRACVVDGKHIKATLSIGVALTSECNDLDMLMNKADDRMYAAKQNGKNQFVMSENNKDDIHLVA